MHRKIKIGTILFLAFLSMCVFILAIGGIGLMSLYTINQDVSSKLAHFNDQEIAALQGAINSEFHNALLLMICATIFAFAIVIAFLIFLPKGLKRPLNELADITKKIAKGDLNVDVTHASQNEYGVLAHALEQVDYNLKQLVKESKALTAAASAGDFDVRADADAFDGGYREILAGVNNTLDTVADKVFWYESMIDSMHNPFFVFDCDKKIQLVNTKACEYLGESRENLLGQMSKNLDGFDQFIKNNKAYSSRKLGTTDFKMVISHLYDRKGEKIGFVETGIKMERDKRKAEYQKVEIERLSQNLEMLAQGRLDFDLTVATADEYTQDDCANFVRIRDSLKVAQKNLSDYIGETADVLGEVAEGNLNVSTDGDFKGEFVRIKESMNKIIDSLNDMFAQIRQSSNQVLSGAGQVASASQALSQGSTEQASSIEELSATIEDISVQIKMNAQNAQVAQGISVKSAKTIESLSEQMDTMILSMERISDSSQRISKIIKTIDDIAFQTNILALNAAVEAARAGEAGKGFAVVADEVRNLAGKSAEAAKDTATLIENSMSAVEEGTKIADETAKTLAVIVDEATKSGQIIGEISSASASQAMAITQTTQGVGQISSVVQTNSATAEETAAASEELSGQADMLNDLVGRFKLREQAIAKDEKPVLSLQLPKENAAKAIFSKSKY